MRYLKFSLLGTVLCAMVFSTGYSSDSDDSNQNINNFSFDDKESPIQDSDEEFLEKINSNIGKKDFAGESNLDTIVSNYDKIRGVDRIGENKPINKDIERLYQLLQTNPKLVYKYQNINRALEYEYYEIGKELERIKEREKIEKKYKKKETTWHIEYKERLVKQFKVLDKYFETYKNSTYYNKSNKEFLNKINNSIDYSTRHIDDFYDYHEISHYCNRGHMAYKDEVKLYQLLEDNPELVRQYKHINGVLKYEYENLRKLGETIQYEAEYGTERGKKFKILNKYFESCKNSTYYKESDEEFMKRISKMLNRIVENPKHAFVLSNEDRDRLHEIIGVENTIKMFKDVRKFASRNPNFMKSGDFTFLKKSKDTKKETNKEFLNRMNEIKKKISIKTTTSHDNENEYYYVKDKNGIKSVITIPYSDKDRYYRLTGKKFPS